MSDLRALTMPKWGIEMSEGTLSEWKVAAGDSIKKGQIIALVETDKIVSELEAEDDATIARLVAESGEIYPVGALLAVLGPGSAADAEISAFVANFRPSEGSAAASAAPSSAPESSPTTPAASSAPAAPARRLAIPDSIAISPAARELAEQRGIDVTKIGGSGRRGRITFQDVDQAARPAAAPLTHSAVSITVAAEAVEDFGATPFAKRLARRHGIELRGLPATGSRGRVGRRDLLKVVESASTGSGAAASLPGAAGGWDTPAQVVRMSPTRKAIARQLSMSKATIPHFYLRAIVRVDALIAMRNRDKLASPDGPTLNDYFLRAAALALLEVPDVNIQVHDDSIHRFAHADISVAVATDKGLITPILRAADTKSIAEIAMQSRLLAERARAGKLRAEEFQGGSFSVSNLGKFGIDQFDAIINPPQGAILAIGAVRSQPVPKDGGFVFSPVVNLSLSCDHRAIDGAVGAGFMATLRDLIESPEQLTAPAG